MASSLPSRLLGNSNGNFSVLNPNAHNVTEFEIISYTWGKETRPYNCDISGDKLQDIKRLMVKAGVEYLWVDCLCINQDDDREKAAEIAKMYQYYKSAKKCHILIDMEEVWDPQDIVNDLQFIGHVLDHMRGSALASHATGLTHNLKARLAMWGNRNWQFEIDETTVMSAAVDTGVLNCYSTCIRHVRSLFRNLYFSRVWTFQEMILGKNLTMWGISPTSISYIGQLHTWMDLATDSNDKAIKLHHWIDRCRHLKTVSVKAILRVIGENIMSLSSLQTQVRGISSARTDIINGGPHWWRDNYKGISNIFSAVSIRPRQCKQREDIFRGLLGIFSGLFTQEEVEVQISGDDIDRISFNFFKKLSIETGRAWTKLAVSNTEREGGWNWIPVVENESQTITTDCFGGVLNLGRLKTEGRAKAIATTGISGVPRKFMDIRLGQGSGDFQFIFRGCNCGKELKTGRFSSEPIPTYDQPLDVVMDETGRVLVQCATILGAIMDPGNGDIKKYRWRLLNKLQPKWRTSDPSAKPADWIERSVSGTPWENPIRQGFRTHNLSMNYRIVDLEHCGSRLANGSTASALCVVTVNCGCTIVAPFALIFEAITAVEGSSLGDTAASLDEDSRIVLRDGLGLVQVGDVGKMFNMVAFGGNVHAHKAYSTNCRRTRKNEPVYFEVPPPIGRALVREEFNHKFTDMMRDYGYVDTGGSGNLLICRKNPMKSYKIVGFALTSSSRTVRDKNLSGYNKQVSRCQAPCTGAF